MTILSQLTIKFEHRNRACELTISGETGQELLGKLDAIMGQLDAMQGAKSNGNGHKDEPVLLYEQNGQKVYGRLDENCDMQYIKPSNGNGSKPYTTPTYENTWNPDWEGNPAYCRIHDCVMQERQNSKTGHKFFSHRTNDGWCNGKKKRVKS